MISIILNTGQNLDSHSSRTALGQFHPYRSCSRHPGLILRRLEVELTGLALPGFDYCKLSENPPSFTELRGPATMDILFLVLVVRCFLMVINNSLGAAGELMKNIDLRVSG